MTNDLSRGMRDRLALTERAHQAWIPWLRPGSLVVDATAGNGSDTLFLAEQVGEAGKVYAMDIQASAIEMTRSRLQSAFMLGRVNLICADHSDIFNTFAYSIKGSIDLICFNLGYLPGGDHDITTRPASTIPALLDSLKLLHPRGALSVMAYRGHPGAAVEAAEVEQFFKQLKRPWTCIEHITTGSDENPGPVLWMAAARES